MNIDPHIAKLSLGFLVGVSLGLFVRLLLFRMLIILSIPALILLILDYSGIFFIDWLYLDGVWNGFLVLLTPLVSNIISYLSHHVLVGLVPGAFLGWSSRFFFMGR